VSPSGKKENQVLQQGRAKAAKKKKGRKKKKKIKEKTRSKGVPKGDSGVVRSGKKTLEKKLGQKNNSPRKAQKVKRHAGGDGQKGGF